MEGIINIDYVECPICGKQGKRIYKHINNVHNLNVDEFKEIYPDSETTCISLRKQIQRNTTKSLNEESVVQKRREFRNSPEGREMARNNGSKVWDIPGFREFLIENNSKAMIEHWKDEDFRESQSLKITEALNCERVHNLHHERLVKQWENLEYRNYMTDMVANMVIDGTLGAKKEYIDNRGKTCIFRSSWEFEFHNILNDLEIDHEYESKKFFYKLDGKTKIYIPDFYILSKNIFIEIKPKCFQNDDVNILKLNAVRSKGYEIIYIGDDEYNNPNKIKEILHII